MKYSSVFPVTRSAPPALPAQSSYFSFQPAQPVEIAQPTLPIQSSASIEKVDQEYSYMPFSFSQNYNDSGKEKYSN